jgi:hypothetical protein
VQGGGLKPRAPHGGGQTASITQPARPMLFWLPTLSGIWSGSDRKKSIKNKIFFFKITLFYGILLIFVGTQATKK